LFSQTNEFSCISNFDTNPDYQGMYSYATTFDKTLSTNPPMVLNIKFWDLRQDDGSSNTIITETDALHAVANLNIAYNIYFKYRGFDHIDDDIAYFGGYNIGLSLMRLDELGFEINNSLNVLLSDITEIGNASNPGNICQVPKTHTTEWITIHEIGHNLGLVHTFYRYNGTSCEHVTRDPNDTTYFNATTHGDDLVDTAAISTTTNANNYDYYICNFTQQGYDCQGEDYALYSVDLLNYMNINRPNSVYSCRTMFSTGQGVRMRETILGRPDIFIPISATVPDLYEPYSGIYNSPDLSSQPKFQPGFDYKYLNCYPDGGYPQPSDYNDISFNYVEGGLWWYGFDKSIAPQYFNSIIHKNGYAIRIEQLNHQPRKCWNNGIAQGGTVIKFNDNVFNTNVTINEQDSTEINNDQLINDLQPGLYNVIKNYQDGRTNETVILKENN